MGIRFNHVSDLVIISDSSNVVILENLTCSSSSGLCGSLPPREFLQTLPCELRRARRRRRRLPPPLRRQPLVPAGVSRGAHPHPLPRAGPRLGRELKGELCRSLSEANPRPRRKPRDVRRSSCRLTQRRQPLRRRVSGEHGSPQPLRTRSALLQALSHPLRRTVSRLLQVQLDLPGISRFPDLFNPLAHPFLPNLFHVSRFFSVRLPWFLQVQPTTGTHDVLLV